MNGTETNLWHRRLFPGRACGWHFTRLGWKPAAGSSNELILTCRSIALWAPFLDQWHEVDEKPTTEALHSGGVVELDYPSSARDPRFDTAAPFRSRGRSV